MRNRIDVYNKCDDSEYRQKKDEVIEKMLKLIENSGMNFYDAQNLPMELDSAISASVIAAQGNTAFRPTVLQKTLTRRLRPPATYTQKRIPNTHRQNAPPKMHSDAPQMIPIIRMCCEWLKPK